MPNSRRKRQIVITLTETNEGLFLSAVTTPPIEFQERMLSRLEQVGSRLVGIASDMGVVRDDSKV